MEMVVPVFIAGRAQRIVPVAGPKTRRAAV